MKPVPLFNRELSRIDYNGRVLARAEDRDVPLIERLRFLTYCSRNLDEFFMIRVGSIRDLIEAGITERSPDGITPKEQMESIRPGLRMLLDRMNACLDTRLLPQLREKGIAIEPFEGLGAGEQETLRGWFRTEVLPVLTPLAIDPGHPFPFVTNQSLNLIAAIGSPAGVETAVLIQDSAASAAVHRAPRAQSLRPHRVDHHGQPARLLHRLHCQACASLSRDQELRAGHRRR